MKTALLRRPGLLAIVTVGVLAVGPAGVVGSAETAGAATPASGTVSTAQLSTTWTGGPGLVSNPTGTALDTPDCTAPSSCDDYALTVTVPAGYDAGHQLKVSVGWDDVAADFDIYLLDSGGQSVAQAATSGNPEVMIVPPVAGTYTVRVVPFSVAPTDTFTGTASLVSKPTNPAPNPNPAPRLRPYGAPQALPDSHNAGEPSIGNSFRSDATFYQSYLSTYRVRWTGTGFGAKASWHNVSADATKGCPAGSTASLDPILYTDHKTGLTLESQLTAFNSATCRTTNNGQAWSSSTGGGLPSGVDHQTLGGGPYAPGDVVPHLYPRGVYYCSQDIATALCALSRDGGQTFGNGVPAYNLTQCGGLHGHIKVAPDGTAYLPNKSCGANQGAAVSEDNGLTWEIRPVPGTTSGDSDPSVGVGKGGAVYFGYVGADGTPRIAVSNDKGQTWVRDQAVGTTFGPAGVQNAVFPAVVAGDNNRAAFAFLGTTTAGDYQNIETFNGIWDLYVAYTYDGGRSWATSQVSPTDAVQRGTICTSGTTCGNNRNLLDFMDVTIDKTGRVLVGYADGCTAECITTAKPQNDDAGGPFHDAYARIARQYDGKTLFAAFD